MLVLNQSRDHWLLSDTLDFAISINLKLEAEPKNVPYFETLMKEEFSVVLELICLTSKSKKEVCIVLDSFLSFLTKYKEKKTHNILSLMLNPRFKNLCLVSSFIHHQQGYLTIVGEYAESSLYPIF